MLIILAIGCIGMLTVLLYMTTVSKLTNSYERFYYGCILFGILQVKCNSSRIYVFKFDHFYGNEIQ